MRAPAAQEGIEVTGEVEHPSDYLARAKVCINPIQVGAGMQNKLLEFMAIGKPVVATPLANEGIGVQPGRHLLIAHNTGELADLILQLFADPDLQASLRKQPGNLIKITGVGKLIFLIGSNMFESLDQPKT